MSVLVISTSSAGLVQPNFAAPALALRLSNPATERFSRSPLRLDDELADLRTIARCAERIFETGDEAPGGVEPQVSILREALRSAKGDIAQLAYESSEGSAPDDAAFRRAELRIELALALFEYRHAYGYTESDEDRQVREAVEAEQARAVSP